MHLYVYIYIYAHVCKTLSAIKYYINTLPDTSTYDGKYNNGH